MPIISTERPSAGPSADLIPAGSLQSEEGSNLSLQHHTYTLDLPEDLVRYGITDRLEFRVQSNNAIAQHTNTGGFGPWSSQDAILSGKVLIGTPNHVLPRSAIFSLSVPSGGQDQTSGSYDPGAMIVWTQSLPKNYALEEVAGATLTTINGARRAFWYPSIGVTHNITEAFGAFAEYAPSILANGDFLYIVDGGLTLASTPTRQVDLRVGYQHDSAGSHTLLSFGYSFRLDHFFRRPAFPADR